MKINPYAVFLWVMLGIPGIALGVMLLGELSLMMYVDVVGSLTISWPTIIVFIVFLGPLFLAFPVGMMGGFQDCGESAEGFVKGWFGFMAASVVIFVLPALLLIGAKHYGIIDYIKGLFA